MAYPNGYSEQTTQILPKGTVLIAGGGPVGLILAQVLSHYGVKSILFERNRTTTSWPKMDLTNARSMELFRKLGLADNLRQYGVPAHIDQNVLISSGLRNKEALALWELPGVNKFRKQIKENNDGTQPLEPWQRLSQVIFEKWLKTVCDEDPLVDVRFGWKVESIQEEEERAVVTVRSVDAGVPITYIADYVVGCDGASSKVRASLDIPLDGGPLPVCALLVHFKSRDYERLHKQGRFWHIFFLEKEHGGLGGAIIAQDEIDTWTTHLFLPLDAETDKIDSYDAVYRVLGGVDDGYAINIDEILVRSVWRPSIAISRHWHGPNHRVFLAGDAAHQNIPTGGYGMNLGIADAFDLGWKLSSVINGWGGKGLLESYELERKPVAVRNVQRSGVHFQVHEHLREILAGGNPQRVNDDTQNASALRNKIRDHYKNNDGENKDFGIEMGYRYKSPIVIHDESETEPSWVPSHYTPTSWPGGRPPHVFLADGSPIFDKFGKHWTLLVFSSEDCGQHFFTDVAELLAVPLKHLDLHTENIAKDLYEKALVLIRPDGHVAWRGDNASNANSAEHILRVVTGQNCAMLQQKRSKTELKEDGVMATEEPVLSANIL